MRALVLILALVACNAMHDGDDGYVLTDGWPRWEFPHGLAPILDAVDYHREWSPLASLTQGRLFAIAVEADWAEVARVRRPLPDRWEPGTEDSIPIVEVGPSRALTPQELARLQVILGEPRFRRPALLCMPHPGVRVRFHRGDATADLMICAHCGQLELADPGGPVALTGWPEMGFQKPAIIGWLRGVYPDEPRFREPLERF
jgi:hypothetical protein